MTKFSKNHISANPIKQLDKAQRLRDRAKKLSEKSGESGDYDYENPRVQKLLAKAKEENKPKPQVENDARISASYERPDMPPISESPLYGAYESGADSMVYVSSAPAFSKLQNQINASTKEAIYGLAKDKKDEEISDAFNSFSFKPKDLSSRYKTTD